MSDIKTYPSYDALPDKIKALSKKYRKTELLDFLAELGIEAESGTRAYDLMVTLVNDLLLNGVPEIDDSSDELLIFLQDTGFVDEEGELLDFQYEGGVDALEDVVESEEEPVKLPECFGFADLRAPECRRCKVYDLCAVERVKFRPPCFGKLFAQHADECLTCIEASSCRLVCGGVSIESVEVNHASN